MAGYKVITEKKVPPRRILCPVCNFRFYPTRRETKMFFDFGSFDIYCTCGCRYQVINMGLYSIVRREAQMEAYKRLYQADDRFQRYVDTCSKAEGRPVEEILAEKTIQNVGDYYKANPKREEPPVVAKMQSGGC